DLAISNNTIDENVAANTPVGNFSTTDSDTGDTFTYSLVSGTGDTDNSAFTISGDQLTINISPDHETQSRYDIRVNTTDAAGETYQKELTFDVNNVNEAPTDIALSNNTIDENVAANTPVGNLSSTDPDTGDTFTYSLVSGAGDTDNGTFNISGDQLTINSSPDYENKLSYSIRVETTDAAGETYQKELTINVNDLFDGNSGNDILRGTAAADSIYGLEGRDKLYGKGGNDIISGGADSDIVKGDSGDDQLNGDDGRDRLYGGTGNDIISGGEDKDIVKGNSGDDQLNGDAGPDRLYGGTGNDILLGGDGNDLLYGQDGDDELNGGPGRDRLYGSDGIDTFVLGEGQERDSIYNFAVGTDKIKLEGSLAFGDLNILPRGSSTLIEVAATGEDLAIVSGVNAADINNSSVFV
ncbi:MAG: hypothetical protein MK289_22065, partial [Trichodesmium sp. ALOHA_ZT_67]|nr:hypothetical protein [Trichodesmium sp. ALOHA_ZT_67]